MACLCITEFSGLHDPSQRVNVSRSIRRTVRRRLKRCRLEKETLSRRLQDLSSPSTRRLICLDDVRHLDRVIPDMETQEAQGKLIVLADLDSPNKDTGFDVVRSLGFERIWQLGKQL